MKYKYIFGLFSFLLFISWAYAKEINGAKEESLTGLQFMKLIYQEGMTKGDPLILFSDAQFTGSHNGNIVIIKGKAKIEGEIKGNIYIYGADVYISKKAVITGAIKTISSKIAKHREATIKGNLEPLISTLYIFKKQWTERIFSHYTDIIPPIIIQMARVSTRMIVGLLLLSLSGDFIQKQCVLLYQQTKEVLYSGVMLYLMNIALILVFVVSVIGFPIALLIIFTLWGITVIGETVLAVMIGRWLEKTIGIQWHIYLYFLVGSSVLQMIYSVPLLGELFTFIVSPLVAVGLFAQFLLEQWVFGHHFSYENHTEGGRFSKTAIYEIITKDLSKKGDK
jgi:hypothetical protein